jgi:putative cardiolipin synthase
VSHRHIREVVGVALPFLATQQSRRDPLGMKRRARRGAALCLFALGLGAVLLRARTTLPSLEDRPSSTALTDTDATRLGRAIAPRLVAHPGRSGIHPLQDAREAFAARMLLARTAERSLDVQYYIWRQDLSGTMLFEALRDAAERGVRVRLLLDDNSTSGMDATLAVLDSHPNIEVRLFNPFVLRRPRLLGYLTDFSRLNRRMHNKSFTADNQATIVGGRNIGDEYFAATTGVVFVDLDVLAVGPVVRAVSEDFDRYWASSSAYPVDRVLAPAPTGGLRELASAASATEVDPAAGAYLAALRRAALLQDLLEGRLELEWAATRLVSDDPAKGLGRAAPEALLSWKLKNVLGEPTEAVDLVSPYFVPTAVGVEAFAGMAKRGVKIRVLTNSLEATDVTAVHAGYAKRRRPLLEAGVALYELKRGLSAPPVATRHGFAGSSDSSLHAKTFSVDRSRVFVGSFNFDPRSAKLNTEMGLVIESRPLAQQISAGFESRLADGAYELRLSQFGDPVWIERRQGKTVRQESEPGTNLWKRAGIWLLSVLPIEWLL